jgi:hypothetical protein
LARQAEAIAAALLTNTPNPRIKGKNMKVGSTFIQVLNREFTE